MKGDNIPLIAVVMAVALVGVVIMLVGRGNISTTGNVVEGPYNSSSGYFCSDTDGSNYYVKGITYGYPLDEGYNYQYTDFCLDDGVTLVEYSCKNNNVYSETFGCKIRCANGKCE